MLKIEDVTGSEQTTDRQREEMLKDHYYRVNPSEYFERRLWGVIAIADYEEGNGQPWRRSDPDSVVFKYLHLIGKDVQWEEPPGDTLGNRSMAVVESYALMQHVIETTLRLFAVARSYKPGVSPVMDLVNLVSPSSLREHVDALLGPRATQIVRDIFPEKQLVDTEGKDSRKDHRRHVRYLTEWLTFFARFYSDKHFRGARGNNQLKHGAITTPHLDRDVVTYVETLREPGFESEYLLRTDSSDVATNLVLARVGISMIQSLWQLSEVMAYPGEIKSYSYDWSPLPEDVFANGGVPLGSTVKVLKEKTPTRAKTRGSKKKR